MSNLNLSKKLFNSKEILRNEFVTDDVLRKPKGRRVEEETNLRYSKSESQASTSNVRFIDFSKTPKGKCNLGHKKRKLDTFGDSNKGPSYLSSKFGSKLVISTKNREKRTVLDLPSQLRSQNVIQKSAPCLLKPEPKITFVENQVSLNNQNLEEIKPEFRIKVEPDSSQMELFSNNSLENESRPSKVRSLNYWAEQSLNGLNCIKANFNGSSNFLKQIKDREKTSDACVQTEACSESSLYKELNSALRLIRLEYLSCPFDALGVDEESSASKIKKAHRNLTRELVSEGKQNTETFSSVQRSFRMLKNPLAKQILVGLGQRMKNILSSLEGSNN